MKNLHYEEIKIQNYFLGHDIDNEQKKNLFCTEQGWLSMERIIEGVEKRSNALVLQPLR